MEENSVLSSIIGNWPIKPEADKSRNSRVSTLSRFMEANIRRKSKNDESFHSGDIALSLFH